MAEQETGYIRCWKGAAGYGFIVCDDTPAGPSLFFHASAILRGVPAPGRRVRFTGASGPKGLHARNVEVLTDRDTREGGSHD